MSPLQRLSLILFKVLLAITLDYIRSGLLVLLRACSLIFSLSSIHHCSSYLSIITVCFLNKYGVAQVLYRSNLSLCEELAELVPHLQRDGKQLPVLASTALISGCKVYGWWRGWSQTRCVCQAPTISCVSQHYFSTRRKGATIMKFCVQAWLTIRRRSMVKNQLPDRSFISHYAII